MLSSFHFVGQAVLSVQVCECTQTKHLSMQPVRFNSGLQDVESNVQRMSKFTSVFHIGRCLDLWYWSRVVWRPPLRDVGQRTK